MQQRVAEHTSHELRGGSNGDANPIVDLAIIGAGPTGLFAAYYGGLRQMSMKLIDSLEVLGGQLTTLYPEKFIYDVAGFPRVLAKDLASQLAEQAMQYNPQLCLGEQAHSLTFDKTSRVYTVTTNVDAHHCRALVIAAGIGAFTPRTLPLANAEAFVGRGLYYSVRNLDAFRDKRVLIVGGGDSAVDWANAISPLASRLTLIHRRDQFRAQEAGVLEMRRGPTQIRVFHELKAIHGDDKVERAVIVDNRSQQEDALDVDAVLVSIGFLSSLGPIAQWGLDLHGSQIIVQSTMQTNREGIFAAGDVAYYPGKLRLIATGFGEAATAVNHAKHYIDPKAGVFPGHSSEMQR